jgi:hypothetical protein
LRWKSLPATLVTLLLASAPSMAGQATFTSTVDGITPFGSGAQTETVAITFANQPTVSCSGYQEFVISPGTVPDAQTRNNMYALLLMAKATGISVSVAYEGTPNASCESGRAGIYYLTLR